MDYLGNITNNKSISIKEITDTHCKQYTTMPTASIDLLDKIVQYIGTTTSDYTNGYFYKCIEDTGTYKWNNVEAQASVPVIDNLTSALVASALSANQGKVLNDTKQKKVTISKTEPTSPEEGDLWLSYGNVEYRKDGVTVTNPVFYKNGTGGHIIIDENGIYAPSASVTKLYSGITDSNMSDWVNSNELATCEYEDADLGCWRYGTNQYAYKTTIEVVALDYILKVYKDSVWRTVGDVIDSLTSTSTTHALSANQGKVLNESINTKCTQYTEMPTASADLVGKVVQYIGTTTSDYINGCFYKCAESTTTTGTYEWVYQTSINPIDLLTSTSTTHALSANQGKVLNETKQKKVTISETEPTSPEEGDLWLSGVECGDILYKDGVRLENYILYKGQTAQNPYCKVEATADRFSWTRDNVVYPHEWSDLKDYQIESIIEYNSAALLIGVSYANADFCRYTDNKYCHISLITREPSNYICKVYNNEMWKTVSEVINSLASYSTTQALSAYQGKILNDSKQQKIKVATTDPTSDNQQNDLLFVNDGTYGYYYDYTTFLKDPIFFKIVNTTDIIYDESSPQFIKIYGTTYRITNLTNDIVDPLITNNDIAAVEPVLVKSIAPIIKYGTGSYVENSNVAKAYKGYNMKIYKADSGVKSWIPVTAPVAIDTSEFITVQGGTLKGALVGQVEPVIKSQSSGTNVMLYGGTSADSGATLALHGSTNANAGAFELKASDGTNAYTLKGTSAGALTWNSKNVFLADGSVNMTGTIVSTNKSTIVRQVDDDALVLSGGTDTTSGATLTLYGKSNTSNAGQLILKANKGDTTNSSSITLITDGKAIYDCGGQDIFLMTLDDAAHGFNIVGSNAITTGAQLRLYGGSFTSAPGQFDLIARSAKSTYAFLTGKTDGTLTWAGNNVLTQNTLSTHGVVLPTSTTYPLTLATADVIKLAPNLYHIIIRFTCSAAIPANALTKIGTSGFTVNTETVDLRQMIPAVEFETGNPVSLIVGVAKGSLYIGNSVEIPANEIILADGIVKTVAS